MTRDLNLVEPEALLFWAGWELPWGQRPVLRPDGAETLLEPVPDHFSENNPGEPQPSKRLW